MNNRQRRGSFTPVREGHRPSPTKGSPIGLTLHFDYGDPTLPPDQAEQRVRAWHAFIREHVSPKGSDVIYDGFDEDHGGGLVPGLRFLTVPPSETPDPPDPATTGLADRVAALAEDVPGFDIQTVSADDYAELKPCECWFFWTNVDGAEPFLVGLARYPETVATPAGGTLDTRLGSGWHWQGVCKTQYSSDPEHGGDDHFIQTHTRFVQALDRIAQDLPAMKIADESGYADHRDEDALRAEIRRWNAVLAAFAGRVKDAGLDADAPIMKRPDFEHLEAEGDAMLRRRQPPDDA